MTADRELFEAAMEAELLPAGRAHPFYQRMSDGAYMYEWMQYRWIGFQAALRAAAPKTQPLSDHPIPTPAMNAYGGPSADARAPSESTPRLDGSCVVHGFAHPCVVCAPPSLSTMTS